MLTFLEQRRVLVELTDTFLLTVTSTSFFAYRIYRRRYPVRNAVRLNDSRMFFCVVQSRQVTVAGLVVGISDGNASFAESDQF